MQTADLRILAHFFATQEGKTIRESIQLYMRPLFRFAKFSSLSGLFLLSFSQTVASATTIDFEGLADSTPITTQYSGLTFTNTTVITAGIGLNEFQFPPHSGTNVAFDDGGPITITFASQIQSFSGYFTYSEPLTILAFDSSKIRISSVDSTFANNEASSGDLGSNPNEFLTIGFAGGISSVRITGDPPGGSFVMDDLSFSSSSVPEPTALVLFLNGLAVFLVIARRRVYE